MIRTLQDHGIHLGIDVDMEYAILALFKDRGPGHRSVRLRS